MANNRMYLVNRRTAQTLLLAKYYPETGWYVYHDDIKARLDTEFNKADCGAAGGMWGLTEWSIEYERKDEH